MTLASQRSLVRQSLARPYRVTFPMVLLVSLVPVYLFIPDFVFSDTFHEPALGLDRMIPLQPPWALVYGALYGFLILLPVFVVRQQDQIRSTVYAYLTVWITAYVVFLFYPTAAPRPETFSGEGFGAWGLASLYDSDPPYNCFPSLHVAHSFVSALTTFRVHRRLGMIAILAACVVALSTLFTKQHYVVDVIAGALLAYAAYLMFLRRHQRENVPDLDRLAAPALAACVSMVIAFFVGGYWVVYQWSSVR